MSWYFQELATLKKSLEEDAAAHETAMAEMRHKYSQDLAIINEQMEAIKKVSEFGTSRVKELIHTNWKCWAQDFIILFRTNSWPETAEIP
jgi:hypothetical protein